jgi:hypothetical protein
MRVNLRLSHAVAVPASVILALVLLTATQATQRDIPASIGISNFGCINENLYRGAQPGRRDYADLPHSA